MERFKMYIGGKWVDAVSGKTYRAINPANEE
jgi:acyl-CoA reductase-like NAD-dependent aldehyde dehydrogenase